MQDFLPHRIRAGLPQRVPDLPGLNIECLSEILHDGSVVRSGLPHPLLVIRRRFRLLAGTAQCDGQISSSVPAGVIECQPRAGHAGLEAALRGHVGGSKRVVKSAIGGLG